MERKQLLHQSLVPIYKLLTCTPALKDNHPQRRAELISQSLTAMRSMLLVGQETEDDRDRMGSRYLLIRTVKSREERHERKPSSTKNRMRMTSLKWSTKDQDRAPSWLRCKTRSTSTLILRTMAMKRPQARETRTKWRSTPPVRHYLELRPILPPRNPPKSTKRPQAAPHLSNAGLSLLFSPKRRRDLSLAQPKTNVHLVHRLLIRRAIEPKPSLKHEPTGQRRWLH